MSAGLADEHGRTVILLDEPPSLGGAYARALARPARNVAVSVASRVTNRVTRRGTSEGTDRAASPTTSRATSHEPTSAGPVDQPAPALPPVRYRLRGIEVDQARLAAYREVVHDRADGPLPAGYVHVLAFPVAMALLARDDFPLPLAGLVHLANTVTVHRAIGVDEPLTADVWAQDLRPHRRGTQVDVVADVRDEGGATVWEGTSTYLARGIVLPGTEQPEASEARGARHDEGHSFPLPTAQWRLGSDVGRRYARVSGDVNPIHLSPLTAKMFGFPRTIAHGMYTAARALAAVGRAHGDAFVWTAELAKPVLLPGTVAVSVRPDTSAAGAWSYEGWDPHHGVPHFRGAVTPRVSHA